MNQDFWILYALARRRRKRPTRLRRARGSAASRRLGHLFPRLCGVRLHRMTGKHLRKACVRSIKYLTFHGLIVLSYSVSRVRMISFDGLQKGSFEFLREYAFYRTVLGGLKGCI